MRLKSSAVYFLAILSSYRWTYVDSDIVVGTVFKRPKVRVYPNYNLDAEISIGVGGDQTTEEVEKDAIGLKPPKPVVYSSRPTDKSYSSNIEHDPLGMEHLYYLTDLLLAFLQPAHIPPEIAKSKSIDDLVDKVKSDNGMSLMKSYVGMVVFAVVNLLIGLSIPLVGLVFCCCRCAGRCGGGKDEAQQTGDTCKRAILAILMFFLVIVMLFGIVCAFVTNEYVEKGLKATPSTFNDSIDDIHLYLRNTRNSVNSLLKDNYDELSKRLDQTLDRSGDIVKNRLGQASEAFAINNLTDIVSGLERVRDELRNVSEKTTAIQTLALDLQIGLSKKRSELLAILSRCPRLRGESMCRRYDVSSLSVTENFNELPNVSSATRQISSLIQNGIVAEVKKGKLEFNDISLRIQNEVQSIIPEIKKRIENLGVKLKEAADNITSAIKSVDLKPLKEDANKVEKFLNKYSAYRWYACIVIGCVILLVTLLLVFGLFCGACGKSPGSVFGDDSCNKGTGANFMLMAISIIIILGLFMMVVNICLFVIGGLTRHLVCHPAHDMADNPSFLALVDTILEREPLFRDHQNLNLKPSQALVDCHHNKTIYQVLNLKMLANVSNIQHYQKEFKVGEKLDEFLAKIKIDPDVQILSVDAKRQLLKLAESNLTNINFTAYSIALQDKITPVDISELAIKLETLAQAFVGFRNLTGLLRTQASELQIYKPKYVDKIKSTLASLRVDVQNLERDIKFNQTSFREAIYHLISTVEKAQEYIRTNGKEKIDALANSFVQEFTSNIDGYAKHLQHKVENVIGQCWPVSRAINSTVVVICKNVLLPFNGFWTSVGWCLIVWLPVLLIGTSLSILYRRYDPYACAIVESQTFDSYLDRDNIPLAHVDKKQRRRKRENGQSRNENRNSYVAELSPTSGGAGANRSDRRRNQRRSNGYMPAPTSSEETTPNATVGDFNTSTQTISMPPEYLEKPPPYYFHDQ